MWFKTRHPRTPLRGNLSAFLDESSEIEGRYVCAGTVMFNGRLRGELSPATPSLWVTREHQRRGASPPT